MKIDRSLFVTLTVAMAGAAACGETTPPPVPPPPPTATMAAEPPPPPPAPPSPPEPTPVATATIAPPPEPPPPPPPPAKKPIGEEGGCASKKKFDASKKCSDDVAAMGAPRCNAPPPFPSTEVCSPDDVDRNCKVAAYALKPKLAAAAAACLRGRVTQLGIAKKSCYCEAEQCLTDVLMGACPDPAADDACKQIDAKCSGVDMNLCKGYLSGMTPKGRDKMVACLSNDCGVGFESCLRQLDPSL